MNLEVERHKGELRDLRTEVEALRKEKSTAKDCLEYIYSMRPDHQPGQWALECLQKLDRLEKARTGGRT